jgi:hypothetical protein
MLLGYYRGWGETLSQDDIADKEEWFKKKENAGHPELSGEQTKQDDDSIRGDERNAK